jgi:hypothetical protein
VSGYQLFGRLGKCSAGVLLVIPLGCANVFQEPIDFFFGLKDFPIQVSWIPVDQNTSQVKYYGLNAIHVNKVSSVQY